MIFDEDPGYRRESWCGFSFLNSYQTCNWKFYIRYILGIASPFTAPPLLFGGAIHESKAVWYKTGSENKTLRALQRSIEERETEYQNPEGSDSDILYGELLMRAWIQEWGKDDFKFYDILSVEEPCNAILPNGYKISMRSDVILRSKQDGRTILGETKTTRFSVAVTEAGVQNSDQITLYLWVLRKAHPEWDIEACMADIMYQNHGVVKCPRTDLIFRTQADFLHFELQTVTLLSEISQKIRALNDFPHAQLFPRHAAPGVCTSFNRPCEYQDICRSRLIGGHAPEGFRLDPWVDFQEISNLRYDLLDRIEVEVEEETRPVETRPADSSPRRRKTR